ncbi:polysaccharide pyruvyl transferase family protein [Rosistilla oblonga]|uniref:polysaccharide pyruvyl transferase family protein n=1 Tax=Rosistilla oblonga TaxID=2527990 RepID=UPI0018D24AA5|nr:polysaccharide pyruvyl transferase family protein [Rosistilla oblonga]
MAKQLGVAVSLALAGNRKPGAGYLICSAPVPERNRGDQALLKVVVEHVATKGGPHTILTTSDQSIESLCPTKDCRIRSDLFPLFLTTRSFREQLAFPRVAGMHREMLVIGADVLDEGYGEERSVASMDAIDLATKLGIKTRILGFSVNGKPSPGLVARMSRLGKRTRLLVRDPVSFRRLQAAGIPGIEQVGDLAYLLNPAEIPQEDLGLRRFVNQNRGNLIGINLTQVVLGQYGAEQHRLEVLAEACRRLAIEDGVRFLLLPHDEPEGVEYLRAFQEKLHREAEPISHLVSPLPHAQVLKHIAGLCKHVFTCRLHLGIASLGMGRPITGFPYQGKFEGQFELFGLSSGGLVGAERFPESADEMASLFRQRISLSAQLSEQIRRHLPAVLELSKKNFEGLAE